MASITDNKRIRGHILDKLENLERALGTFTNGTSKGKEIEYFDSIEEREWRAFHQQVVSMSEKLKKKLIHIFRGKKLSAAEMSRLPESVRISLYPTEEEKHKMKHASMLASAFKGS